MYLAFSKHSTNVWCHHHHHGFNLIDFLAGSFIHSFKYSLSIFHVPRPVLGINSAEIRRCGSLFSSSWEFLRNGSPFLSFTLGGVFTAPGCATSRGVLPIFWTLLPPISIPHCPLTIVPSTHPALVTWQAMLPAFQTSWYSGLMFALLGEYSDLHSTDEENKSL